MLWCRQRNQQPSLDRSATGKGGGEFHKSTQVSAGCLTHQLSASSSPRKRHLPPPTAAALWKRTFGRGAVGGRLTGLPVSRRLLSHGGHNETLTGAKLAPLNKQLCSAPPSSHTGATFLANSFWHLLALRYVNKVLGWEVSRCS